MYRSLKNKSWSSFALTLGLVFIFGCKARDSESGLLAANQTVTETTQLNKSVQLKGKGKNENFVEIAVDKTGLLRISVSMSNNASGGFTKPVGLAAFSEADLNTPLASGAIKIDPSNPQDASAEMFINVPAVGKYFVLVQHNQQLEDDNDYANLRTRIIQPKAAASNIINTIPGSYDATDVYDGKGVTVMVTAPKVLSDISIYSTIYAASPDVISEGDSACKNCSGRLQITSGSDVYKMPLPKLASGSSSEAAFQFDTGTYKFELIVDNLPAGSLIDWNVDLSPIENNQGGPFSTVGTLGMLGIAFDQNTSRRSSFHGKPFGFAIDSDRASEAKLEVSIELKRILNLAKKTDFPKKMTADLSDATPLKISSLEMDGGSGTYFNGDLISDFEVGKYNLVFSDTDIDDADIINLTGSLDAVELTIRDGGPDASTFQDLNQVTITPPNNYLVDLNVPAGVVYTPQVKPVDLASASVLAAMERIRTAQHVRIPKGTQRTKNNRVDANTISACLGNEATHWSDLIIHYYCQLGQARSCYTNTIRGKAQSIGGDQSLDQAAKIQKLQTIRTETFAECAATVATNPHWAWLMDKQQGDQAEVFQYVMNSQTFAFDMEQQQALINKFYRINDPKDKTECNLKRPRRAIDPGDGTHCLATKIFATPMTAVGR
jgi:hypothetical protein